MKAILCAGRFLALCREGHWEYVERINATGAAIIVAVTNEQRLLLVEQYRIPVHTRTIELPAGIIGDEPGSSDEAHAEAARRELLEETGYHASQWARAGVVHNAAAYSTEGIEIWFARGLSLGTQRLDAGEFLELCLMDESELEQQAASGELTDVKTLIGLLWLQKWRAGLWPLDWVDAGSAAPEIINR